MKAETVIAIAAAVQAGAALFVYLVTRQLAETTSRYADSTEDMSAATLRAARAAENASLTASSDLRLRSAPVILPDPQGGYDYSVDQRLGKPDRTSPTGAKLWMRNVGRGPAIDVEVWLAIGDVTVQAEPAAKFSGGVWVDGASDEQAVFRMRPENSKSRVWLDSDPLTGQLHVAYKDLFGGHWWCRWTVEFMSATGLMKVFDRQVADSPDGIVYGGKREILDP